MHIRKVLTTIRRIFVCLVLGLLLAAKVYSANNVFVNYSKPQGLAQNTVTDIVEDNQGFIWFSTFEGISRFDGYEFKNYTASNTDPFSLPDNFAKTLLLDLKGNLWIGTRKGLAKYDPQKDNFVNYTQSNSNLISNEIFALSLNRDGKLMVSTSESLYLYDERADVFLPLSINGQTLPADIKVIYSEEDRTWLGSLGQGLFILEHASNSLFSLKTNNPWDITINANYLFDIKVIEGRYWIASEAGVFIIDLQSSKMDVLNTQSTPAINGSEVRSILQHENGEIWLGTNKGINVLDNNLTSAFSYDDKNGVSFGLDNTILLSSYKDSNNTIWLGTYSSGIYRYNEKSAKVKFFQKSAASANSLSGNIIWGLDQAQNKTKLWAATQSNGINLFDPTTFTFEQFVTDFEHLIWALAVDESNRIWIASASGIHVYEYTEQTGVKLVKTLLSGQNIQTLSQFSDRVWLRSYSNSIRWINPQSLELESVTLDNSKIQFVDPLFLDSTNNLWAATNLGMMLYNLDSRQIQLLILNFDKSIRHFNSVIEMDDGYWLSTLSHGLIKLDKNNYQVLEHINAENGLASDQVIRSIKYQDSLWVSHTTSGIDEVSLTSATVLQNIAPERLEFNEFNEGVGLLSNSGQILFGGSSGFIMFDPKELSYEANKAKQIENINRPSDAPSITQLRVFNLPVTIHSVNSPLTSSITTATHIELPNDSNMLSLKFSQVNPMAPEAVKYRYRLLGLSNKWIETDSESPRRADFSNLSFGNYEFVVQSQDPLSSWSTPKVLKIKIAPPFWLEQNALVLYGLLSILLLLYWLKQIRSKNAVQRSILENEERLKLTLWSSGDELWDWDIYQGQVFRSNTWGTLDFPQDDIRVNSSYEANIHPNDIQRVQQSLNEHLGEKTEHYEVTYRAKTYKGEWLWILDRGKVVSRDANHQPQRMTGTLKNISHLKEAEEQLKLFKRSIETISDGVFITDTSFKFISVNNSYCKYTGETREQALASYLTFHQYPGAFTEEVKKSLQQKGNWFGEVESRRTKGEKYEMELNIDAITDEDGKISHYVGVFSDITSRKGTEKELLKLSNTDPLTELPNRSFFQASHNNIVRRDTHHALICLDMDNFKKINDSLGHQTGDILIKQIAKRLQKMSGTKATCYRLGGDEFSVLIDNSTDIHYITHFAQTILDNMARPFIINKQEFVLGASVGIAFYPEDGSSPQELLKNADTAMYFAKNAGGNKYQFFSGEMNQNAVRQLQIENLIRHGLKEDLFTVFYQPKVDIATGKLVSMEALVRYEHPEKGIVSPAQFVPLAEQTGQIVEIGELVLRKACEDTKRWVDEGLFTGRVAVNISARQFEIPDLDERISNILQKVGLSALHLECEITEGTLMQNPENALRMMQRLRERGIHLALDDFGTGYSSLAYLKRFPINTLKIDKAFIDDIAKSAEDRHMAQAIITIAHNLGLKVVAEGVEYENQLAILRRYKCEMLQGYLYSKPLNSSRFERLLKENHELRKIIQNSNV